VVRRRSRVRVEPASGRGKLGPDHFAVGREVHAPSSGDRVKLRPVPSDKDLAHLKWLREQIGDDLLDAVVVTTGREAYRRAEDGIAVVPAALLRP
jgi:hypothetical protein